ncbi:hypothetical protein [Synechococcus sp. EJ6-Ellesmere]|jgi:hypothetical protein|uniref:hypothetical protein n=1 Tax=Synechococcus sp. EJ6-Ellesmere TaxID=2823734 RepID=UPI0020CD14CE|nr:hypothetical protein [Synechococcus sp. EJ6-Ellesmere]MCP9824552.1 hypothetical protein [Synechococcus sp. EJ6-Ellesmere]
MTHLHSVRGGVGGGRPQGGKPQRGKPQLPAFCRTRRPTTTVTISSLRCIYRLLLLVLVFQLSTLLLVIAGPVQERLTPATATNVFRPDAGTAAGGPFNVTPSSDR